MSRITEMIRKGVCIAGIWAGVWDSMGFSRALFIS
jgi:hypothetical protein